MLQRPPAPLPKLGLDETFHIKSRLLFINITSEKKVNTFLSQRNDNETKTACRNMPKPAPKTMCEHIAMAEENCFFSLVKSLGKSCPYFM